MRLFAARSAVTRSVAPRRPTDSLTSMWLAKRLHGSALQRKSSCACGGSCSRCQEEQQLLAGLPVSIPGDAHEREADRIAAQAVAGGSIAAPRRKSASSGSSPTSAASSLSIAGVVGGAGSPLEPGTRHFFESRLGHDFSEVRVHSGSLAAASARSVGARAYTVGPDIVFASGEYAPGSPEGAKLLAHELVHAIQQRGGTRELQRAVEASEESADLSTERGGGPGPTEPKEDPCAGWLRDPESLSIAASRHYRRTV